MRGYTLIIRVRYRKETESKRSWILTRTKIDPVNNASSCRGSTLTTS